MAMGASTIGSLATSSTWKPLGTLKVFNSSAGVWMGGGGSLNLSSGFSGPRLLVWSASFFFFLSASLVAGSLAAKEWVRNADAVRAASASEGKRRGNMGIREWE